LSAPITQDEALIKKLNGIGDRDHLESMLELVGNCPWEPFYERNEDVVAIAVPECVGSFIPLLRRTHMESLESDYRMA